MPQKLTIFFSSTEGYGWTEKYYFSGAQTGDLLTAYMRTVAHERAMFLTSDGSLERFRLQSTHKRDPMIFDFENDPACKGQLDGTQNNSDNAVLARMEATGVGYNRILIRGILDGDVNQNVFTPSTAWLSGWMAWVAEIRDSGNWSVVATVDNPQMPITPTLVSQNSPKGIRVTLAGTDSLPVPSQVLVKGSSVFGYNGVKNVTRGPTATQPNVYLLGGARPQSPPNALDAITLTPKAPLDAKVTDFFYERFTTRAAGRPFGQRRGRRPTTFSLRL
jgi:hypothetical protein